MQPFLAAKRETIAEICRKHYVRRLSVFGSAARDDFDAARSDVDLIVEFGEIPFGSYVENKYQLRDELAESLSSRVDLLTWKSVKNHYLLREIENDQETLYAA